MPDAGVCMGRLPKQPADYIISRGRNTYLIEVKEEKREDKIAGKRLSQKPKMVLFGMTGHKAYFLIHHYEHGYWRCVPVSEVEKTSGTLNISHFPTMSLEDIFENVII